MGLFSGPDLKPSCSTMIVGAVAKIVAVATTTVVILRGLRHATR